MNFNMIDVNLGGGSIIQLANRTPTQMMSYVIKSPDGKVMVIDGGTYSEGDGMCLYNKLVEYGKVVDLWIITHAHDDHYGALGWILNNRENHDIEIKRLCFSFPPTPWHNAIDPSEIDTLKWFYEGVEKHGMKSLPLIAGDTLLCGELKIDIITDGRDYKRFSSVNDTTSVLRVHFPKRDVLFLGDLGKDKGKDVLNTVAHELLRCDIVQMAHHGQDGADKEFYEIVRPKICLYTAPCWLWDNDNGGGKGSGPWKTLVTRKWMEDLGAVASLPAAYGDYLLV